MFFQDETSAKKQVVIALKRISVDGLTDEQEQEKRKVICIDCDKRKTAMNVDYCSECNCILYLKLKIKKHSCPIGKWENQE